MAKQPDGAPQNPTPQTTEHDEKNPAATQPAAVPVAPTPGTRPAPTPAVASPTPTPPGTTQAGTARGVNQSQGGPADRPDPARTAGVPPQTGAPNAGPSPQQMAEAAARRQASNQSDQSAGTPLPSGFRMGRTVGTADESDVTLGQFVALFRTGIEQVRSYDFWGALATAGHMLNGLSHLGQSQNSVPPVMSATPEHAREHDDWNKCLQEFAAVKGQAVAAAPQWAAQPAFMQAGGPTSGVAAGLAAPSPRTVGFDPANILLLIQVFQTVADLIEKFRNRT